MTPEPEPAGDNWIDAFKEWFKGGATDVADEVLKKLVGSWPAMYYLSTGVDFSTDPPTNPVVIKMLNGEAPRECVGNIGSKCGGTETREGWKFDDSNFLTDTQCAECYKTKSPLETCNDGYEKAYKGWIQSLCCKAHQCSEKKYRASDLPELFHDIGRDGGEQMMQYALTVPTTADPGVPVHCVLSHNVQTFSNLTFSTVEDIDKAMVVLDDGDMTVDEQSLEVCSRWKSTVKVYRVPGVIHSGMLDIKQILDVIMAVATNDDSALTSWNEPKMSELQTPNQASIADASHLLVQPKSVATAASVLI